MDEVPWLLLMLFVLLVGHRRLRLADPSGAPTRGGPSRKTSDRSDRGADCARPSLPRLRRSRPSPPSAHQPSRSCQQPGPARNSGDRPQSADRGWAVRGGGRGAATTCGTWDERGWALP